MMRAVFYSVFGALLLPVPLSWGSGATSSGGGNSINNGLNPWFLENTEVVTYCVEIDEENMGIDRSRADELVEMSLRYWTDSFRATDLDNYDDGQLAPYGEVRLGTQSFVKTEACLERTDLRFQFGVLNESQRTQVRNPQDFIGLAMRTDYDPVELRGKGYVYVAPQSGELRPTSSVFAAEPWSLCDGCLLEAVLKHELGHVFGMRHVDTDGLSLMSESFPANVTHRASIDNPDLFAAVRYIVRTNYLTLSLAPVFVSDVRTALPEVGQLFGLSGEHIALRIVETESPPPASRFQMEAYSLDTLSWEPLHSFCWAGSSGLGSSPAASVYITDEQRVFSNVPQEHFYGLLRSHYRPNDYELSGSLCDTGGNPTLPILVQRDVAGHGTLSTIVDGMIKQVLYDSQTLRRQPL